jgi:2-dehydropantoate 2-reductase
MIRRDLIVVASESKAHSLAILVLDWHNLIMPRILVFGSGSVGVLYSFLLHKAGAHIVCVCRSNYHVAQLHGFTIKSTIFGQHSFKPTIVSSVEEAVCLDSKSFDFVLVCTKAIPENQASVVTALLPAMTSEMTSLVIIQNGLGVEKTFAKHAFPGAIISGVTYSPTSQIEPGVYSHTETQRLSIGCYPAAEHQKHTGTLTSLSALLEAGGSTVTICEDIQVERWKKLIGNTTWNPICALSRCRDLEFLSASSLATEFVRKAMKEVVAVAAASGYAAIITEEAVEAQLLRSAARKLPGVEPSMMADMRLENKLEVEAIIGEVVSSANALGVDTPRLETMYVLLSGLDWSLQAQR